MVGMQEGANIAIRLVRTYWHSMRNQKNKDFQRFAKGRQRYQQIT